MPDPVTPNRGFAQPVRGSDVGTWDVPLNGNASLSDTISGGVSNIAIGIGGNFLNSTQLANGTLVITGNNTAPTSINFPAIQGWWSIFNLTQGAFPLLVAAGTGTNIISVPPAEITDIQVNGNSVFFRNLGRIGSYMDYAGIAVPSWISSCTIPPYLNCDGSTFNGGTYPYLVGILGNNILPDLRGRSRAYLNGGTNRITSGGSGINGDVILSAGGQQNIQLIQAHLPNLTLPVAINDPGHFHAYNAGINGITYAPNVGAASGFNPTPQVTDTKGTGITATVATGGSALPFTNMGPTTIGGITLIRAG